MTDLTATAYVARERAAAEVAINREVEETLAALDETIGRFPHPDYPFSREHIRLLIRSAFLAGVNYQFNRAALLKGTTAP
jgi:hypothetical protein